MFGKLEVDGEEVVGENEDGVRNGPPKGGAESGAEESFPRCGKLASMVWKNGKTGFHGVELFPKLASMAWKNGETGFHGMEAAKGGR